MDGRKEKNQIKMNSSVTEETVSGTTEHKALSATTEHLQLSNNMQRNIVRETGIFKAYCKFCHSRKGYKNFI